MAALVDGGISQPSSNGIDTEILNNIKELIINRTGCPPVNADHLYALKQYFDRFPHPCPTIEGSIAGGTIPTPHPPQPVTQNLQGWGNVNPQDLDNIQNHFNHYSQEDQQLAYNHFFQKLHRAPSVLEFSRFLQIYEGQLYLENEEFRETLRSHLRSIELLEQMMSSKNVMIEVLGQSSTENGRKIHDLQTQKDNLQRILCTVQQDKAQLQLDHNALKQEYTQCLAELEDERKDKQVSQHMCQQLQTDKQALQHQNTQLQNTITTQTGTITDMQVTIHEHEQNTDRLTDMIRDLRQKLHRESRGKSEIYDQLVQKTKMVSELEDDRALFMMENEAQTQYFLDMKEEQKKLQIENKELKEYIHRCKNILKAQYDKLISTIEVSLSRLEENLALMKEKNSELSKAVTNLEIKTSKQSITISDLESKNSDLETKNSDLETKNSDLETKNSDLETKNSDLETKNSDLETKNSDLECKNCDLEIKNSDLETKNSDLETKNSDLETKNSDLETKNSDLETKNSEQSITISDLETKNSDLETKNSDLETKNSDLEKRATRQSNTVSDLENKTTELQLQTQRQQLLILFLVALVFTLICLHFTSSGSNAYSTS
ncbi:paramyosin-like isoform X2 [Saccostrea cucullata]|uniref:paramyosin-like isoform X2 n=1 Tax=Saccostrea cuccullata TaxID=36930 RepID=UPI002ED42A62